MMPCVVLFTGLPASGKKTLAREVSRLLSERGVRSAVLDGMTVRRALWPELGFTKKDKDENVLRLGRLAVRFESCGVIALVAAIAPYEAARQAIRSLSYRFVEVHMKCPVEVCRGRDPRGLYADADKGVVKNVPGVDDPYEVPRFPEIVVESAVETPIRSAELVVAKLLELR